jgi:sugar phosphate isomerase/epimerase
MKLAYSSLACRDWTIEEAVAAAARYGYDAIEWRLADGETLEPETAPEVWRRLREVPAAHGIEISCLDTSCRVTQDSPESRSAVIEAGKRMIDRAAELGAPFIRVFGGRLPAGTTRAELLAPTAEVLHALGTHSAPRGVTVLLETHDSWTSSEDVLALIQATALPSVRVLWDTHHTYRAGESPARTIAVLAEMVGYVHMKDSQPASDTPGGWHYCLLNEGTVPLREICSALKGSGYTGYLALEWEKKWHPEIAEPEIALPQAVPWLRRLWHEASGRIGAELENEHGTGSTF